MIAQYNVQWWWIKDDRLSPSSMFTGLSLDVPSLLWQSVAARTVERWQRHCCGGANISWSLEFRFEFKVCLILLFHGEGSKKNRMGLEGLKRSDENRGPGEKRNVVIESLLPRSRWGRQTRILYIHKFKGWIRYWWKRQSTFTWRSLLPVSTAGGWCYLSYGPVQMV